MFYYDVWISLSRLMRDFNVTFRKDSVEKHGRSFGMIIRMTNKKAGSRNHRRYVIKKTT